MKISKQTQQGLTISVFTILLTFTLLEVGTRLLAGIPLTEINNYILARRNLIKGAYPSQYDSTLGWIPKIGHYEDNLWNINITIHDLGIRDNGNASGFEHQPHLKILAVGDSFTFGDEVRNDETWPAILESLSQVSVINAGVFGYGFDQTVLRAEKLVDDFGPQIVIISLIPDDINRAQLSIRSSVAKPYFELDNDQLVLKNVPPDPARPEVQDMGLMRSILGHSAFLDVIMNTGAGSLSQIWYGLPSEDVQVHNNGVEVSCKLLQRLDDLGKDKGFTTIFLVQYYEPEIYAEKPEKVKATIACAQENDILVLDLFDPLRAVAETDENQFRGFFQYHMTAVGNAFVAERLYEFLLSHQLLSPSE